MNERIVTLSVAVLIGIIVGVGVVSVTSKTDSSSIVGQQLGMIINTQGSINERLNKIDEQQTKMMGIFEETKQTALRVQQQVAQGGPQQAPQQRPQPPSEDLNKVHNIPIDQSPVRGNKNAKVIITKFVDFQCPFCARFYPPVLEILKAYPNDVKFVIKNFPLSFHPQAKPAAKAALAAGEQGKYWEMVDKLFENNQNLTDDKFKELAQSLGLNVDKFMKDYKEKDAQWEAIINKDMTLGSEVDVRGTPTFYINGKKTMARDLTTFKTEVDNILKGGTK